MVLAYSEATGDTEGSTIAAIISVQTGTNAARPSPIVPAIPAIPRASAMVAAQAPAARISRNAASRVARPGRCRASPAEPLTGPWPLPHRATSLRSRLARAVLDRQDNKSHPQAAPGSGAPAAHARRRRAHQPATGGL